VLLGAGRLLESRAFLRRFFLWSFWGRNHRITGELMPKRRLICSIAFLLPVLMSSSCSPGGLTEMQRNVTLAAQQKLQRTMANHFTRKLGESVDLVIGGLSAAGGFLDNPLVRVLLPPPMGLVLSVARDFQADPQATVLEQLMNHAAEAAIPGAGPILRAAVKGISPADAETLLQGGTDAASEFLKARTRDVLMEALAPAVAESLTKSGANEVYASALKVYELQKDIAQTSEAVMRGALPEGVAADIAVPLPEHPLGSVVDAVRPPQILPQAMPADQEQQALAAAILTAPEPPRDLGAYVTGKAVDGLFGALAEREKGIRREIQNLGSGLLPTN
jgi:hypothetical protein